MYYLCKSRRLLDIAHEQHAIRPALWYNTIVGIIYISRYTILYVYIIVMFSFRRRSHAHVKNSIFTRGHYSGRHMFYDYILYMCVYVCMLVGKDLMTHWKENNNINSTIGVFFFLFLFRDVSFMSITMRRVRGYQNENFHQRRRRCRFNRHNIIIVFRFLPAPFIQGFFFLIDLFICEYVETNFYFSRCIS